MSDLRNRMIRLAYENPHLRGKLLPAIKKLKAGDVSSTDLKREAAVSSFIDSKCHEGMKSAAKEVQDAIRASVKVPNNLHLKSLDVEVVPKREWEREIRASKWHLELSMSGVIQGQSPSADMAISDLSRTFRPVSGGEKILGSMDWRLNHEGISVGGFGFDEEEHEDMVKLIESRLAWNQEGGFEFHFWVKRPI